MLFKPIVIHIGAGKQGHMQCGELSNYPFLSGMTSFSKKW